MPGPRLIVGCPVRDRAWILPRWFDHVERATARVGIDDPLCVFVVAPDDPSVEAANQATKDRGWWEPLFVFTDENSAPYERVWGWDRYAEMVLLRNRLLREVREWGPELFWSLDSDILAADTALELAVDALHNRDFVAVGQRCYMTLSGTWCPSYAMLNGGGLLRYDAEGCFPVDVIMASKVMTAAAYAVDYETDEQGEDIGWSNAVRRHGLKLGWDGRSISKHVMEPHLLDVIDDRCGF